MNLQEAEQLLASRNYFEMTNKDFWTEVDLYASQEEMAGLETAENIYLKSLSEDTALGEYSEDGHHLA